jgi:Ca2+-binding RTX toxin-like protein
VAAPGEPNQATASFVGGVVTVRDTGAVITAGAGCIAVDAHEVNCAMGEFGTSFAFLDDLDDTLALEGGMDWVVEGGAGNDTLTGCPTCAGDLYGETGDDTLSSNGCGRCSFWGNAGGDTFIGSGSPDFFYGGSGNDTLNGLGGDDDLVPGAGDDSIDGGPGADDVVDFYGSAVGIKADLRMGIATGQGTDTLIGVESIIGSAHHDYLIGDSNANDFSGLEGADILVGRGGADELAGGCCSGNDHLFGGPGDDLLLGGAGDDWLRGGPGRDRLLGQAGNDALGAQDGFQDRVRGGTGFDRAHIDRGLDNVLGVEKIYL